MPLVRRWPEPAALSGPVLAKAPAVHIWLDMANSPHPVLLGPVGRELERRGHKLTVTGRDHAQTRELALREWSDAVIVGGESPTGQLAKARSVAARVRGLRRALGANRPDVAVSLGSYAQILAARSLRARVLTLMDYEHQPANHLSFRLAHRIVVPAAFPAERLRHYGASNGRVRRFDGFKEEMYLDQPPDPAGPPKKASGKSLAVFRPPPEGALYHRHGNTSFDLLLSEAISREDVEVLVLPRMGWQYQRYSALLGVRVPEHALPGVDLLQAADVFVGAGGTMCREAALLGVRAYTMFAGRPSAVDAELIERGLLFDLRGADEIDADEIETVDWSPRGAAANGEARRIRRDRGNGLRRWLIEEIEALA